MHNIWLIVQREYLSRVRKKSFIVMTLLSPLLIAVFYGLIFYTSINRELGDFKKEISVVDPGNILEQKLKNTGTITYTYTSLNDALEKLKSNSVYGVLQVSETDTSNFVMMVNEQLSLSNQNIIEKAIESVLQEKMLASKGISKDFIVGLNQLKVNVKTQKLGEEKSSSSASGIATGIGFTGAFLIYMFIFLYGVQIMRGVIEEKTNRIVEVLVSTIKPFELMMGKIIGIALVGLTQFVIWIILISVLSSTASGVILSLFGVEASQIAAATADSNAGSSILSSINSINFTPIISMFLFYFLSGYLFYGALFAAIGAAVDSETDTQQFMLPITLPLIFGFVIAQSVVINAPNGSLATWLSILPLTAPVVMMVRIPFEVAYWQIAVSMLSMILGFIFTVWLASKVYRIGILTYGKKPTYKEIVKWMFAKD